jgi:hypothetical protein
VIVACFNFFKLETKCTITGVPEFGSKGIQFSLTNYVKGSSLSHSSLNLKGLVGFFIPFVSYKNIGK